MIKYCISTFLLFFTIVFKGASQTTINSSSNDIYSIQGFITLSIGETFYTYKGSNYTQLEGIQNSLDFNQHTNYTYINVSIYPNPTNDFVHFKIQNVQFPNLSYHIYDAIGNLLIDGIIFNYETTISLNKLPASVYLIKIFRDKEAIKSYQIIKIN
jgi:hypothetical protein